MDEVIIMMVGLRGKMGKEITRLCEKNGVQLSPITLTAGEAGTVKLETTDYVIELSKYNTEVMSASDLQQVELKISELMENMKAQRKLLIAVDFTFGATAAGNVDLYIKLKMPFVLGTTGLDLDLAKRRAQEANVYAVIAPNMCKQIVCLQAMLEFGAREFPQGFQGYSLNIKESHQKTKKDTSGTAKALLQNFNALIGQGSNFKVEDIEKIRDEKIQKDVLGVPETYIQGHAWHTYTMSNESVLFQFRHNVNGRETYAQGTLDAVYFLFKQINDKSKQIVFDMVDVLRSGKMT